MADEDQYYPDEDYDDEDVAAPRAFLEHELGAILGKALNEVNELGGPQRAMVAGVIGKDAFNTIAGRRSTARALDAWVNATPKTRPAATKMLATAIAHALEVPHQEEKGGVAEV
jgi:hypothetical protein